MFTRPDKMKELLAHTAAEFIKENANTNPLITVTHANIDPAFKNATIFVTVYPESMENVALDFLKRKRTDFRSYVKSHARLKYLPFFDFQIDYGERNRQRIDELFEQDRRAL